jgi:hypothetical protein
MCPVRHSSESVASRQCAAPMGNCHRAQSHPTGRCSAPIIDTLTASCEGNHIELFVSRHDHNSRSSRHARPQSMKLRHSSAALGTWARRCLVVKHSFTPPSGRHEHTDVGMCTPGLHGAGQRSAMCPATLAASSEEKPRPCLMNLASELGPSWQGAQSPVSYQSSIRCA